ncbi:pyridoxamine 5'-phosphate oxidase [Candidatus Poribacteria bacterium]|nr:pyridoxamine 5'-phosphate oxidase [Candidatus Poribacteria bacterium]
MTKLRREYTDAGLNEQDLDANPFNQFDQWFQEAIDAKIDLPDAMTLATATQDGIPSARIVLLRGHDERGFVFYTDYESQKGKELAENPKAALVFYWRELDRQVRITGQVSKVSRENSQHYFQSRPIGSRLAALASKQSEVIPDRRVLEDRFNQLAAQYQDEEIPLPADWGGYRLSPDMIEFWSGRPSRLHDRLRYTRQPNNDWRIERISP